jgi:hypothetical protein
MNTIFKAVQTKLMIQQAVGAYSLGGAQEKEEGCSMELQWV